MERSEYYMPGLEAGVPASKSTPKDGRGLNQSTRISSASAPWPFPPIPPCMRIMPPGRFHKATDIMVAQELVLFLESLSGHNQRHQERSYPESLARSGRPAAPGPAAPDRDRPHLPGTGPGVACPYRVGRRTGGPVGFEGTWMTAKKIAHVEAICRRYHHPAGRRGRGHRRVDAAVHLGEGNDPDLSLTSQLK